MTFQAGAISTTIHGDAGPLAATFAKAEGLAQGFAGQMSGILAGVAAAASLGGFAASVKHSLGQIDEVAKTADRLGITTEAYTALAHQANLAGVQQEELDMSLQHLQNSLGDAAKGAGTASASFRQIGIDGKAIAGLPLEDVVGRIADGLNTLSSATDKANVLMDLFGARGGPRLAALLADGSEGIRKTRAEAEALGITFGRDAARSVEAANDAVTRATAAFNAMAISAAVKLSPALEGAANVATGLAVSIRSLDPGTLALAANTLKWAVALGAAVIIAPRLVAIGATVVKVFQAIAKSEAIVLALGGPKSWATLAVGLAVAAGAAWAVDKAFASAAANAQEAAKAAASAGNAVGGLKVPQVPGVGASAGGAGRLPPGVLDSLPSGFKADFNEELLAGVNQLQLAAATAGKSADEVEILKLRWMGADEALLGYARRAIAARTAAEALAEDQKKAAENAKAVADGFSSIQDRIASFGLSEGQKAAFDFKKLGVGHEQLREFEDLAKRLDDLNLGKQLQEKAKAIAEGVRTPMEVFTDKIKELQDLQERGLLTADQFARAKQAAEGDALQGLNADQPQQEPRSATFLRAGSQEALKFIVESQQQSRKDDLQQQQVGGWT
jgi:hypothetical protein